MANDGRNLEILVAKIQSLLAPDAEVLHDIKLDGRDSGTKRQIDVVVRQKIGQYEILIVIDCKDHARPVDVKGVETFAGLLKDVGAQKGVLVCPKGFSEAAKTLATKLQMDLFSPIDTDPHKWTVKANIPAICDYRSAALSFSITCSAPVPFQMPHDFYAQLTAFDCDKKELGIPLKVAFQKWNEGHFPIEIGDHENLNIFDEPKVMVNNGYGMLVPVNLTVSIHVSQELYFGMLPVPKISGFKDEVSGNVITNAFTIGMLDPEAVIRDWQKIKSENDLPTMPALTLIGLVGYEHQT